MKNRSAHYEEEVPMDRMQTEMTAEEADAIRAAEAEEAALRAQEKPLDELGRELPDPTPLEPPLNYIKTPSLSEQIREMVRSEKLRMEAEAMGFESFEDADDLEMDEDPDPGSPYEINFDPTPLQELHRRRRQAAEDERRRSSEAPLPPEQNENLGAATSGAPVTEAAPPPKSGRPQGATPPLE